MRHKKLLLAALLALLAPSSLVVAQEADSVAVDSDWQTYTELFLKDGTRLVGHVVSRTDDVIEFETVSGKRYTLSAEEIEEEKRIVGRIEQGTLNVADPNISRTFFAPTARTVPRKTGYVAFKQLFFVSVGYGVGSRLTLSGGSSIFPGVDQQLVWVAPKMTVYKEGPLSVATGALVVTLAGSTDAGGIAFGVATFGDRDKSVTLGSGFFFGNGSIQSTPVVLLSGEMSLGKKRRLMMENYMMPGLSSSVLTSLGIRTIVTPRFTLDVAGLTVLEAGGGVIVPWLGVSRRF